MPTESAFVARVLPGQGPAHGQLWRRADLWLGIVLSLLAVAPVLVARYPQMSDYPAHLARYYVMLAGGHNDVLNRYYDFRWQWTGNVGVDLLIRPFAALFGLELGGRIITGLIPPLTGLGLVAVEWVLRRRVTFAGLLAMAFVWSPMMLIGLLNFAGGQALALWAFALWVAMRDCRWRASVFVPIGVVVWLFHLSAWAILGVLVFGYEWEMRRDWRAFLAPWPLLGPVWIMAMLPGTSGAFSYGGNWWLYKQAIWLKAMRDTAYALDYLGLVAVMLAIGGALFFRRIDGRLGWAGLILLALTIAVPRHISGGDYADYRLVTAGLMICCLAIDWGDAPRWAVGLAPALYLARLVVTTLSWQADSAQTGEVLAALDHVPRGARIASAVYVPREAWRLDHFEHIGAYAVFRRDALTNANFAVANVHMLHLKPEIPGFVDPSQRIIEAASQPLDLAGFAPAEHADWLWYVGERKPDTLPAGAMVWRSDHGLLLRLSHAGDAGALAKSGGAH